jgi:hypothetical protein
MAKGRRRAKDEPEVDWTEPTVRLAVRIPKSLHQRLKMYAATGRGTMQEIVAVILNFSLPSDAQLRSGHLLDMYLDRLTKRRAP